MIHSSNPKGTALPALVPDSTEPPPSMVPFGRLEGSLLEAGTGTCLAVVTLLQVTGWSGNHPKLDDLHPLYNL